MAAPVVTVKGHATIRLLGLYRDARGVMLVGQLQDRDLGTGVPDRTVEVLYREGSAAVRATTDADGRFQALLPDGTAFRVEARFGGDLTYAGEASPAETLDVTKENLELELASGRELDASQPRQVLRLRARARGGQADGGGRPVSVRLSLRTDRGRDLGALQTDQRGEASLHLETAVLGEPGRLALFVHFAGNDRENPVTQRFELALVTPVRITLRAREQRLETGDAIQLEGEVRDVAGPLAGVTVHLEVMGRQTASTASDGKGAFSFRQEAAEFPPGRVDLTARYAPAVSWRRAATSSAVEVLIVAPRPIPLRLYLAPALFTALVLLLLLGWRRGQILRLWLRQRLRLESEEAPSPSEETRPIPSGLRPSRSSGGFRSLVRQAHDVWGTVWDPTDRRPVAGASLRLASPGGEVTRVEADDAGHFRLVALDAGVHRVAVSGPGYVTEEVELSIPHRGQLHDARVDLVQVRVRLLELYREAALPLLPDRELWARWTPRELARHVGSRAGRRHPPLEELTLLLERAYWSGHAPEERVLADARLMASQVGD